MKTNSNTYLFIIGFRLVEQILLFNTFFVYIFECVHLRKYVLILKFISYSTEKTQFLKILLTSKKYKSE